MTGEPAGADAPTRPGGPWPLLLPSPGGALRPGAVLSTRLSQTLESTTGVDAGRGGRYTATTAC